MDLQYLPAVLTPAKKDRAIAMVEAISELRYRPLQDFVPTLLDNLVAPIVSTLGDLRHYAPALVTGKGLLSKAMQRERLQFVDTDEQVFSTDQVRAAVTSNVQPLWAAEGAA